MVRLSATNSEAVRKLINLGVIPKLCKRWELTLDVNEAIKVTTTYLVTEEQLDKIAAVLAEHPEEAKQFAEKIIYTDGTFVCDALAQTVEVG